MKLKIRNLIFLVPFFLPVVILFSSTPVRAGNCDLTVATIPCTSDTECAQNGCSDCVQCISGNCQANDAFCEGQDGNVCVSATCSQTQFSLQNPTGCDYTVSVFTGGTDLDDICYYCDPARITTIDTCGNGVCNTDQGEDCTSCPEDCLIPGWDQPTCPVDPNTINPNVCNLGITFPGPPFNQPGRANCEDGDLCTNDFCAGTGPSQCTSQPKSCSVDISDLCCASGCQGPPVPLTCAEADAQGILPRTECDIDCWPPPVCEDGLVQNPETCDDGLPNGSAGINVTDAQCRDAGTPGECTYCGDGFLQPEAGEQCEVGLIGSCGSTGEGGECDLTTCQCEVNVCVTGSGNIWTDIRPGCANCSLNPHGLSQGWTKDFQAFLLLGGLMALGMAWRLHRRRGY